MPQWATFVGVTGVVLVLLLVLSHLTQSAFPDEEDDADRSAAELPSGDVGAEPPRSEPDPEGASEPGPPADPSRAEDETDAPTAEGPSTSTDAPAPDPSAPDASSDAADRSPSAPVDRSVTDERPAADRPEGGRRTDAERPAERPSRPGERTDRRGQQLDPDELSAGMMLANVAASQGLFAVVLIGAAIYSGIPADALGIAFSRSYLETGLLWGTAFGIVLYVANEVGAAAATWFGFDHDERLRELLAPETSRGWVVLLVGVLPIIAVFEELLFRAALIGAVSAGYGVDPWLLAIGSSIAFALGHGIQGTVGVIVTGLLGFVLAAGYVLTGSLLVVVVAHYWINALEFVVHEGFGFDWADALES